MSRGILRSLHFCQTSAHLTKTHRTGILLLLRAIPHKDCATDASSNLSSDETKSGVNTGCIHEHFCEIWRKICKQMAYKVARRSLCGIAPDSRWCKGSTVQGQRCPRFHTMPAQTAFSQVRKNIFQNKKGLLSCDLCGELRILRRVHFLAVPEKPPFSPCGFSGFLKSWKNFK